MNHIEQATTCEIEQRVTRCLELLLEGNKRYQIVEIITHEFDCCQATVDNALKKAYKVRSEEAEKIRSEAFNDAVTTLTELRKSMYKDRDFKGAVAAQKEINKICGLEKHEISFGEDKEITIKVSKID